MKFQKVDFQEKICTSVTQSIKVLKCKPIEIAYKWFSVFYISHGHNNHSSNNNNSKNSNKNRSDKQRILHWYYIANLH